MKNFFIAAAAFGSLLVAGDGNYANIPSRFKTTTTTVKPQGRDEPIITASTTTAPSVVNESERKKSCPATYTMLGKQCARTVTSDPDILCPTDATLLPDMTCVAYYGKNSECPSGFDREGGLCHRARYAPFRTTCPQDYLLKSDGSACIRNVRLADVQVCPAGTVTEGDQCVRYDTESPEYVCPDGYDLEGTKCQVEETYDCTPVRENNAEIDLGKEHDSTAENRRLGVTRYSNTASRTAASAFTFVTPRAPSTAQGGYYEDYVMKSTCKRLRVEPARKICRNGVLDGKSCLVETHVQSISAPGGYRQDTISPISVCPEGYNEPIDEDDDCLYVEEVSPELTCPMGTTDEGDKCERRSNGRVVCPTGYALEGKLCVQTQFTAPIVEYTVTYSCVGKECGGSR